MTARKLRSRDLVWVLPAGALIASLALPGSEVLARTDRAMLEAANQQGQGAAGAQGQVTPPAAGRSGTDARPGPDSRQGGPRQPFGAWEWWNDDAAKKEVGLSDEKVRKINDIYQDRMRQMKPYADEWEKQLDVLDKMTAARVADDTTYGIQVKRVESIGMTLRESRTLMLYRIFKQLQPDQFQRLRVVFDRMRSSGNGRGGRGPASHTR